MNDKKRLDWLLHRFMVNEMGVTIASAEQTEQNKQYSIEMIDLHIEVEADELNQETPILAPKLKH